MCILVIICIYILGLFQWILMHFKLPYYLCKIRHAVICHEQFIIVCGAIWNKIYYYHAFVAGLGDAILVLLAIAEVGSSPSGGHVTDTANIDAVRLAYDEKGRRFAEEMPCKAVFPSATSHELIHPPIYTAQTLALRLEQRLGCVTFPSAIAL